MERSLATGVVFTKACLLMPSAWICACQKGALPTIQAGRTAERYANNQSPDLRGCSGGVERGAHGGQMGRPGLNNVRLECIRGWEMWDKRADHSDAMDCFQLQ